MDSNQPRIVSRVAWTLDTDLTGSTGSIIRTENGEFGPIGVLRQYANKMQFGNQTYIAHTVLYRK
jgi:hypothetical protein